MDYYNIRVTEYELYAIHKLKEEIYAEHNTNLLTALLKRATLGYRIPMPDDEYACI
jgi:hypothetical protein